VTTDVGVRRALPADARCLAELRWAFKREDGDVLEPVDRTTFLEHTECWIADRLANGQWSAWVAEAEDVLSGHVFLQPVERLPDPRGITNPIGYVTNFYVTPSQRNRGVGTALLRALVDHARAAFFNTLIVWPSERSTTLYHRAGFRIPEELVELSLSI
jgi:GNAT superfamily N-acetyltransferase